jgi:hypothetical protein
MVTKNIVLLSDGTGNSSASPFKTNVWRLYQAIDLSPGQAQEQIVYYVNGVGTENFKPLAALGGALGFGVWRNVKDLYTFVCRNYDLGDEIYGFGFSRGAFTIRLLMGLIGKCGLVKADSEAQLIQCIEAAYEAYRRDYLIRASRRRNMIYHYILRPPKYMPEEDGSPSSSIDLSDTGCRQVNPDIRFLGVWDTVDAYGMPVDEIKIAIDDWVWPMSFADRDPSDRLLAIRHALSLDDERPTFRPVLWNEVLKPKRPGDDPEVLPPQRIQQVWFAGVHANVGGGYPDDGLAYTSLNWMMDEAAAHGLRFDLDHRTDIFERANPHGEQYDSRAGIAGYYRYGPRQVGALCNDRDHGVTVPIVRVHAAAHARIIARQRDYEPVSLDGPFDVGGVRQTAADDKALQCAWDLVWWRRGAYFLTVALTAFVALFAVRLVFAWPNVILEATEGWLKPIWTGITSILGGPITGVIGTAWNFILDNIGKALPSWASPTIPSFRKYPLSGVLSLALLAWLFFRVSTRLEARIKVLAEWSWATHKGLPATARPMTDWRNAVARALRPVTQLFYRVVWRGIFVPAIGILIGLVVLAVALITSPFWVWSRLKRPVWMA